jgi:hypothetical protein
VLPFALTVFLSAFLLFEVQPLIAKYLLPWFGGAPAVWTTCMLFFQVLLLGGYVYAHLVSTRMSPQRQKWTHLLLLLASVVLLVSLGRTWATPITPGVSWRPLSSDEPVRRLLTLLAVSVGLPYLILSSTAPLLQSWYGRHTAGGSPYRLYALSNLGSLLALAGYPFLIEWLLPLEGQARMWSWMYGAFALCCGTCAVMAARTSAGSSEISSTPDDIGTSPVRDGTYERPTTGRKLIWMGLAACGSTMLLATTNQLCLGVAVVPFLWVLPLALYLLTFILCFQNERWYRREIYQPAFGVGAVLACFALFHQTTLTLLPQIAIYSLALFASCMVCHGELVRLKPATQHLTSFYLFVAAGGALGGVFVSLLAPHLFNGYWEYHLGLWGSAFLMFTVLWMEKASWVHQSKPWVAGLMIVFVCFIPVSFALTTKGRSIVHDWRLPAMLLVAVALVIKLAYRSRVEDHGPTSPELAKFCVVAALSILGGLLFLNTWQSVIVAVRNFYGVLSIEESWTAEPAWRAYGLSHGPILHGYQFLDPAKRRYATSYFGKLSAIGLAVLNHPKRQRERPEDRRLRIGVVGLGVGTIATYGEPGDYIRFYEINPEVCRLANSHFFSYLKDSQARVDVILGDARLSMEQELAQNQPQQFDVLVLDAFSGDAIPVHLVTREAFEIYLPHLQKPDGLIAVHISNRFVDLRPVLWKVAEHFDLSPAWFQTPAEGRIGSPCDWVILAPNRAVLDQPAMAKAVSPAQFYGSSAPLWTDNYSNLFRILRR